MLLPANLRERLSERLRRNWSAQHPKESSTPGEGIDESLTSLTWLQNLNIMKFSAPAPTTAPRVHTVVILPPTGSISRNQRPPASQVIELKTSTQSVVESSVDKQSRLLKPRQILDSLNTQQVNQHSQEHIHPNSLSRPTSLHRIPCSLSDLSSPIIIPHDSPHEVSVSVIAEEVCGTTTRVSDDSDQETNYRVNAMLKPPHSYATLICMAMQSTPLMRSTLTDIYTWITDNFAYYAFADPSWQNSVRHNLSLHKCFQKVPRGSAELGKGGFWMINPEFKSYVDRNILKRDLPTDFYCSPPPTKKSRRDSLDKTKVLDAGKGDSSSPYPTEETRECSDVIIEGHVPYWTSNLNNDHDLLADGLETKMCSIVNEDVNIGSMNVNYDVADDALTRDVKGVTHSSSSDDNDLFDFDEFLHSTTIDINVDKDSNGNVQPDLTVYGVGVLPPCWWNDPNEYLTSPSPSDGESYLGQDSIIREAFDHPWAETGGEFDNAIRSLGIDFIDSELEAFR